MAKQRQRPDPTPEEDESEGNAWAKAFEGAEPEAPLTEAEKVIVRDLMVAAGLKGDTAAIDQLTELCKSPTRLREFLAEVKDEAEG